MVDFHLVSDFSPPHSASFHISFVLRSLKRRRFMPFDFVCICTRVRVSFLVFFAANVCVRRVRTPELTHFSSCFISFVCKGQRTHNGIDDTYRPIVISTYLFMLIVCMCRYEYMNECANIKQQMCATRSGRGKW